MPTSKGLLRSLIGPVAVFLAAVVPAQPLLAAIAVGQTASAGARVDGIRVPSGTTLISPAVIETDDSGAVVHLSTGEVVVVAPQSTAVLASVETGIELAVEKGQVAYTNKDGAMDTVSETRTILVAQQGQIQQGPRPAADEDPVDEPEEQLCELVDWTPELWQDCRYDDPDDKDDRADKDDEEKEDCDWEALEVRMSRVPEYLEKTAVLACKDRNDLDLSCDCKVVPIIVWWIPVAALAGGAVIYSLIEDDDEEPVSRTTP